MPRTLPRSTLFPYTTLFRSCPRPRPHCAARCSPRPGWRPPRSRRPRSPRLRRRPPYGELFRRPWSRGSSRTRSWPDRKSTRLNSSHVEISYAVFCLKKKKKELKTTSPNSTSPNPTNNLTTHYQDDTSNYLTQLTTNTHHLTPAILQQHCL